MRSSRKPSPQRPVVEALEPKLLYSADMGLSAFVPVAPEAPTHQLTQQAAATAAVVDAGQAVQHAGTEIAFVDANVPDADALVRDIQQQAANGRAIEVIVIRSDQDGLGLITQTLQDRHDIAAIHLIGHGESGDMQLGSTQLDAQTLLTRAGDIAHWGTALTADADVLLYGCDVAVGTPGHALVQGLAALTGADVAASDDLTGASSLGGDWALEVQTGQIDSALALSAAMQSQYSGVLAQVTPNTKGTGIWSENGFTTPQQGAWDGLTLGTQSNTGVTTTSNWTNIASAESPTRNEAIVVGVDGNGVIRGERWDGTAWTALPMNPLTSSATAGEQGLAVAYEQQSGNAMVVWNNGTKVSYSVFNGTTWTAAKTIDVYNGAAADTIRLAAQPHGNSMALVITDSKQDDYAMIWDGSSWGHAITLDTSGFTYLDQYNSAVAYEAQSGTAMVAYGQFGKTDVYYRTFDGTTWSGESTAGSYTESALPLYLTLSSDPNSDRIGMGLLTIISSSTNNNVTTYTTQPSFSIWNGSSWGSRTVQASYSDTNLGVSNISTAFESLSGDMLAAYGTSAATTRYMTWNSSTGWSGVTTGPNTGQAGALRLYADPYTDHIMMGVQAKSGAISYTDWTGSAFGTVNTVATTSGSTVSPAFTWLWRTDLSGNKTNTLLLGGSTAATGWSGVNSVGVNEVLEFTDPNLVYGTTTTTGTFSHLMDLGALGASGLDDIVMVSRDVTLTAGLVVHRGDILFTTNASSTLSNADGSTTSAAKSDLVMYRPSVAGHYSKGTFTVLVQNIAAGTLGLGTADVRGLALVEQDTVLGDITLTEGTLLFTAGTTTAAADIQRFVPNGGGLLGGLLTGNISTVITGSEIGIGQAITGLELVSQSTPLKNVTLAAGTLLISLEAADTIGSNNLSVTAADVVTLTPTRTSVNSTAAATATLLMRGSSVGASGKVFDSLALSLDAAPIIGSNGGGATASISRSENITTVTTVTATDVDADTLSYSITGGADATLFQIDASTGVLRFISAPNFEAPQDADHNNTYLVTVSASDGTYADAQAITVTVNNVNEAPVIVSDGGGTNSVIAVVEGSTAVTQIVATDVDAGNTMSYSISGADAALFDVNASTGVLTFKVAPSYSAPQDANADNIYNVTLTATDSGSLTDVQYAFIQVTPLSGPSAAPVIDSDGGGNTAALAIHEGDTAVTTVHATDADSGNITYSITGGADLALFDIDPLSGALRFHTAPDAAVKADANQDNIYEVTVSASDGSTNDSQDLSITVQAYNKPPVNTLPGSYDMSENTTLTLTGVSVADADAGSNTITVNLDVQHGVLTVLDNVSNGLNSSQITYSNGNSHVVLTGTLSQINTTLAEDGGLRYRPSTNFFGNDTLTMVSDDGGNSGVPRTVPQTSDTDTATIQVSAADIAPSLSTSNGAASYTENATPVTIDPGLNFSDPDTATFTTARIQITGNYVSTEDVLSFTAQSGITGTWDASTGTLTLSGSATPANYQAALRSVAYRNTVDNPSTLNRTITFSVSDSSSTAVATRDVTITATDDAPTLSTTTSSSLQYTENGVSTPIDPGVTLTDIDSPTYSGATVSITANFDGVQDVLSFTNQAGISGVWNASTGILTLSGTATTADYQAALRSVGYHNTSDDPSTLNRTVTFSVDYGGNPISSTRNITVIAVDDAPAIGVPGTALSYTENEAAKRIAPTLSLNDADNNSFSGATVSITGHYALGQDVLSFTNTANITGSWDAATGILTLSGTDTRLAYQAALQSVRYSNSVDNPDTTQRTVTFHISDGTLAADATRNITITAVNDVPALAMSTGALAYTENAAATPVDGGISLTDPDNTSFVGASIQITGHFVGGEDVLSFTNQSGITGNWDASTGTLTLTGTASTAAYQTALRSVSYRNTSDNPDTTARTVTFNLNDGSSTGSNTRNIAITAVNDAPVLTPTTGAMAYTEGAVATPVDAGMALTDADTTTLVGASVQITGHFVSSEDVLVFTNQSGITGNWDASTGTLTLTGTASASAYETALRSIGYTNTSHNPDATTRTITFNVSDGSATGTNTRNIAITAINDAPVMLSNSLSIGQGGTATPVIDVSDADSNLATLLVSATAVTGGHFVDNRDLATITQFTYGAVQAGYILFADDGSGQAPSYILTLSDGLATSAPSVVSVNYTPLPPTPASPPPPPPPPPTTSSEAPAPAPAPAPAEPPSTTTAPMAQAPAPGGAVLYAAEPARASLFEQELRLPVPAVKAVVDVQPRANASGGDVAAQAQFINESFQFSWTTNLQTATASEDLRRNLDALREQLQDQGTERRHVVASSIALTTGLSVGYVIWLVRGGALIGSMLSAMPAWQMIDPLPVLTRGRSRGPGDAGGDEDQSVEQLFDGDNDAAPEWAPEPMPDAVANHGAQPEAHHP